MEDYKLYEKQVEENKKRNQKFMLEFEDFLNDKKLSPKTIRKHLSNIDLYLNYYLNYYDVTKMEDGIGSVYMYLNDWFIRKCAFSSITSIKDNATSIKKFYKCMCEHGHVSKEDYDFLSKSIDDNMNTFYASYNKYYNTKWEDFF